MPSRPIGRLFRENSGFSEILTRTLGTMTCAGRGWGILQACHPRSTMTGLQNTPPPTGTCLVPNVRVKISEKPEFSRNSRPMGREGTCMDYKTHWVSNSRKSKKYPDEEGTSGMPFYTEMCIFGAYLSPISRKPEFSGIAVHVV